MKLFNESSHLTDEAIKAMIEYELDENNILLFCCHIAECDECSARYTEALEKEELLKPSGEFTENLFKALEKEKSKSESKSNKHESVKLLILQIFKFAVAASLTLIIWGRALDLDTLEKLPQKPQELKSRVSVSRVLSDFTDVLQSGLTKGMNNASDFLKPKYSLDLTQRNEKTQAQNK